MSVPRYLEPYVNAAERHGGGFQSLLWASPRTQRARFQALSRLCKMNGRIVLDGGCGRADLLDYLLETNVRPASYIGIEAVAALADAADAKRNPLCRIIRGDFIHDPRLLSAGANVILFSGSLNTLADAEFNSTLLAAWNATQADLVFNFLSSSLLAAGKHLHWHRPDDMITFAASLTSDYYILNDYLDGDSTILMRKTP